MAVKKLNAAQLINYAPNKLQTTPHLADLLRYKLYSMRQEIQLKSGIPNPTQKFYFTQPTATVLSLFKDLSINPQRVGNVFCSSSDRYSQALLLLTSVGLLKSDKSMTQNAFFLLLAKVWNDAVDEYFPGGIDASIMDKTIDKKLCLKHLLKTHRTPYNMIEKHFLPTLLNTYSAMVIADPAYKTNKLVTQAKMRMDQVFQHNYVIDIHTGKPRYFTGLVPAYKEMETELKKLAA